MQFIGHVRGAGVTFGGVSLQGSGEYASDTTGNTGGDFLEFGDGFEKQTVEGDGLIVGEKEATTRQTFPQDDGGGKNVGARGNAFSARLFWRHISNFSFELTRTSAAESRCGVGDAKVGNSGDTIGVDEDVLWGNIAMDKANRMSIGIDMLVSRVQSCKHIEKDTHDDIGRDGRFGFDGLGEECAEVFAFDVFHHEVVAMIGSSDLEDRHDMLVTNTSDDASLIEEHADESFFVTEVGVESFDREKAFETAQSDEAGEVHGGQSSASKLGDEFVAVDAGQDPCVLAEKLERHSTDLVSTY